MKRDVPKGYIHKIWLIMRLTTVILIATMMQVSASGLAQKISLAKSNASLESIINELRNQSGYDFIATGEVLDKSKSVSINVKNKELDKVLQQIFKDQPITYSIEKNVVMLKLKAPSFVENLAARLQSIEVRGKVVDENEKPLVGATVLIKGTNKSVNTDQNGSFYLSNVSEKAVLLISYIGYQQKEIAAAAEISIRMELAIGELNEVIVNKGYYTETQKLSTGNTVTVTSKDIEKQPVTNPLLALQGRAAGLQIKQSSGVVNGSVSILIRGRTSLNPAVNNYPLYIIDGIPFQASLLGDILGNNGGNGLDVQSEQGNPLNYINPNDIASIDILKDADATAIYGSRGGNGVILITTKKGRQGEMDLNVNASQGFMQAPADLKVMNTQQYLEMRREAFVNDGLPVPSIKTSPNDANYDVNGLWDQNAETNWQKELIGNFAAYTNLNLSLSGGSELAQYDLRGTYNRQGNLFPGEFNDTRAGLSFNTTAYSRNKKLKIDFTGNYLRDFNQNAQTDITSYTLRAPNAPGSFNADGTLYWGGVNSDNANNPYAYTFRSYDNKTDNLVLSLRPTYQIMKGLVFSANLGITKINSNIKILQPNASYSPLYLSMSPAINHVNTLNEQKTWIAEPQLSYQTQIKAVKLNALLGSSFQKSDNQGQYIAGYNFVSDAVIGNIVNAGTTIFGDSGSYLYNYNAVYGRLNANLADKYIVNLTGRRDGSSKFGPGRQFGNFYSAAAAWIFSSESFIKDNLSFLSLGKLRASYGTSGNDGISNYAYYDLYQRRGNTYQGATGFAPTTLANPNVAWEKNNKFELAADLGVFNDRIVASAAYYQNRSSNQLLSYRIPAHTGFSSIPNYNFPATVENSGWEFTLNANPLTKKDFKWSTSFNISINRNKLLKFENLETSSYSGLLEIGQPVSGRTLVGIYTGIDPKTGLYTTLKKDGTVGSDAGNNLYLGHPVYQTTWVNTLPKFFGGLNNTVSYKNLQLDIFLQFVKQTGRESLSLFAPGYFSNEIYSPSFVSSNVSTAFLDRWQKEGDQAKYQRYTQSVAGAQAYDSWATSTGSFVDASFIRAKNVSLSYQLPARFNEKLKLKRSSITLTGQNLFTITPYKGRDPETQSFATLPPLKVFVIGLQVNL